MYQFHDRFKIPTDFNNHVLSSHLTLVNSEISKVYSDFISKVCDGITKKTWPTMYSVGIFYDVKYIYGASVVFQMEHNYSHDPSPAVDIEYNKKNIQTIESKHGYSIVVDVSGSLESAAFEIDMNGSDEEVKKQLDDAWKKIKEFLLMDESIQIVRQKIIEFR